MEAGDTIVSEPSRRRNSADSFRQIGTEENGGTVSRDESNVLNNKRNPREGREVKRRVNPKDVATCIGYSNYKSYARA